MLHIAYCGGQKVCTVERHAKTRKWQIVWHTRQDSREPIANPEAAKQWLATLLHGKVVEWRKEADVTQNPRCEKWVQDGRSLYQSNSGHRCTRDAAYCVVGKRSCTQHTLKEFRTEENKIQGESN